MSDSQRPNPPVPSFEVPDLELDPLPRLPGQAALARSAAARAPSSAPDQRFGSSFDFGEPGELEELEFERSAQPNFQIAGESAPRLTLAKRAQAVADPRANWPTGRALDATQLKLEPREISVLADYGDPPASVPLTLAYAYRVFTRQRELKHQLIPIAAECERAQAEREAMLAEFSRALRPIIEPLAEFRRFLAPLIELESRAAERGQALTAIHAQLGAESDQIDAELAQIASQIAAEQQAEREAERRSEEREADAQRTNAKCKRVQIEMRAVTQLAEQKPGPVGEHLPASEAARLASLQQRVDAMQPEITEARAALEQAKQTLAQVQARLDALRQSERRLGRKKQALGGAYQKELATRSQGVSETEVEQRAALAELARAVLAARGTIDVPEGWLERLRKVCDHADQLIVRAEMQRRAIIAYDVPRARQGVRLACTAASILLLLFTFKLIF